MFHPNQAISASPVRTAGDLADRVEYWHTHETGNPLREFLGISREEYQLWLSKGDDALLEALEQNAKKRETVGAAGKFRDKITKTACFLEGSLLK